MVEAVPNHECQSGIDVGDLDKFAQGFDAMFGAVSPYMPQIVGFNNGDLGIYAFNNNGGGYVAESRYDTIDFNCTTGNVFGGPSGVPFDSLSVAAIDDSTPIAFRIMVERGLTAETRKVDIFGGIFTSPENSTAINLKTDLPYPAYAVNSKWHISTSDFYKTSTSGSNKSLVVFNYYSNSSVTLSDISGVFVSRTSKGNIASSEFFRIPYGNSEIQDQPDVALLKPNIFGVAWSGGSMGRDGEVGREIFLNIVDPATKQSMKEIRVNSSVEGDQSWPSIIPLGADKFVVAWQTNPEVEVGLERTLGSKADSGSELCMRTVTVNTSVKAVEKLSKEYCTEMEVLDDLSIDIAPISSTNFAVVSKTMSVNDAGSETTSDINLARFSTDGTIIKPVTGASIVDTGSIWVDTPKVETLKDGTYAVAWRDHMKGTIRSQIVDPRTKGIIRHLTSGDDNFYATPFDDRIYGLAGDDQIQGGGGDDLINGGPGADSLNGGDGTNTVSFSGATAGVRASLASGKGTGGDAKGDKYIGFTKISGTRFDDELTGQAGVSSTLSGGRGDDMLIGGIYNDVFNLGTGQDTAIGAIQLGFKSPLDACDYVVYLGLSKGVTIDLNNPRNGAGEAADDTYDSIECAGGTNSNDRILGDENANTLRGYDGKDTLDGRAGNDTLYGGGSANVLTGGSGADSFRFEGIKFTRDRITDFSVTSGDVISIRLSALDKQYPANTFVKGTLPASAFVASKTPKAVAAKSTILYDTDSGVVYVDFDGTGTRNSPIALVLVDDLPALTASDFSIF